MILPDDTSQLSTNSFQSSGTDREMAVADHKIFRNHFQLQLAFISRTFRFRNGEFEGKTKNYERLRINYCTN